MGLKWPTYPSSTNKADTDSQGCTGHAGKCQRGRHQLWAEYQGPTTIPMPASSESDSAPQLVGSTPPSAAKIASGEEAGGR